MVILRDVPGESNSIPIGTNSEAPQQKSPLYCARAKGGVVPRFSFYSKI